MIFRFFHYIWFIDKENVSFILILKERGQSPMKKIKMSGYFLTNTYPFIYFIYLHIFIVNK